MDSLSKRVGALIDRRPGTRPADVARFAGVATSSVSDWLHGDTKTMKPEPARKLSVEFGCDQIWLMTGVGSPNWRSEDQAAPLTKAGEAPVAPVDLRQALTVIRNQLVHGQGDQNELIGEALKLMAAVPDSDRAFDRAVSLLDSIKS